MAIRTLSADTPLEDLFHERIFTLTALQAFPLGAPFVADYVALHADWLTLQVKQQAHEIDSAAADALITRIDQKLASQVLALSLVVLRDVNNDKKAPLYAYFFGTLRPSDFKTSIRMSRTGIIAAWLPALAASTNPALKAIGVDLAAVLADANTAQKASADAADALLFFDTAGDRKAFIDVFNAKRKATWGSLSHMPHDHPELNLPLDFADGFFIHGRGYKAPTLAKIEVKIEQTQQNLQLLLDQKTELEARAGDAAKAAATAAAASDAVALKAAQAEAADAAAKIAALKAKLGGAAGGATSAAPSATSAPTAPVPTATGALPAPAPITAPTTAAALPPAPVPSAPLATGTSPVVPPSPPAPAPVVHP